jgi:hypothetical protein
VGSDKKVEGRIKKEEGRADAAMFDVRGLMFDVKARKADGRKVGWLGVERPKNFGMRNAECGLRNGR